MRAPRTKGAAVILATVLTATLLAPAEASAYGGPGSVISGIGALLAIVATIFAAVLGFVWYPVKRLIRAMRKGQEEPAGSSDE